MHRVCPSLSAVAVSALLCTTALASPPEQSTATLACIDRRQKYFKDEFLSALEILHHGDLRPEQLRGSWAGAMGQTIERHGREGRPADVSRVDLRKTESLAHLELMDASIPPVASNETGAADLDVLEIQALGRGRQTAESRGPGRLAVLVDRP